MTANDRSRKGQPAASPLPSRAALDAYFLEARCKLLELAAILDRIGRGAGSDATENDPRLVRILQALEVLHDETSGRAESIQQIFSLNYDSSWERPQPR
jgi:hypothetical protein